jgi:apolipoprotein N-acyltransferase
LKYPFGEYYPFQRVILKKKVAESGKIGRQRKTKAGKTIK